MTGSLQYRDGTVGYDALLENGIEPRAQREEAPPPALVPFRPGGSRDLPRQVRVSSLLTVYCSGQVANPFFVCFTVFHALRTLPVHNPCKNQDPTVEPLQEIFAGQPQSTQARNPAGGRGGPKGRLIYTQASEAAHETLRYPV